MSRSLSNVPLPEEEEGDATQRTFRIVFIVGDPHTYYDAVQKRYKGFVYDLWVYIRDRLTQKHGYQFKEIFVNTTNYTSVLKTYIRDKGYDMVVAPTSILYKRALYVEYSRPFGLNRHCVIVKKKVNWLYTIIWLFSYNFLPIVLLFVAVGLILGCLLYWNNADVEDISAAVSAMVGNRDFMTKQSHSKFGTVRWYIFMIILFVLMVLSTFTLTFLGAFMTTKLLEAFDKENLTTDNINTKTILCPTGYSVGNILETYGAKLVYKDGSEKELLTLFKDSTEYDGVGLSLFDSVHRAKQHGLHISKTQFGMDKNGFALHPRYRGKSFLHHVDEEIIHANSTYVTADIFAKYLGIDNKYLGII